MGVGDVLKGAFNGIKHAVPLMAAVATGGSSAAIPALLGIAGNALGVDSTELAIANAIEQDPDAVAKLQRAEQDFRLKLGELLLEGARIEQQMEAARLDRDVEIAKQDTENLRQINETMRASQAQSLGKGFLEITLNLYRSGWRPTFGYVFTAAYAWAFIVVGRAMWLDPGKTTELFPTMAWLLSAGALVLGVQIKLRSDEKKAANGVQPTGMISKLLGTSKLPVGLKEAA